MNVAKAQAVHGVIANAPKIFSAIADEPPLFQRMFLGSGAPSVSTLAAGNGKYCGTASGFIIAATLVLAGSGYSAGSELTAVGGTGTAVKFVIDSVTSGGGVVDFHISTVGEYSAYPSNPVATTASAGSGATFNLAIQPPDLYFDKTSSSLYICTGRGTNATSTWVAISGGGLNYRGLWAAGTYAVNDCVLIQSGAAAGLFVSTIGSNTNDPATGIGWTQLAPGNTVGYWT